MFHDLGNLAEHFGGFTRGDIARGYGCGKQIRSDDFQVSWGNRTASHFISSVAPPTAVCATAGDFHTHLKGEGEHGQESVGANR